jgi:hypothetical protein
MEHGVQESWTQFLKFSIYNLQFYYGISDWLKYGSQSRLYPLCLSENNDTLVLADNPGGEAYLYNWRDKRLEPTEITNGINWFFVKEYVESLVSTS